MDMIKALWVDGEIFRVGIRTHPKIDTDFGIVPPIDELLFVEDRLGRDASHLVPMALEAFGAI